MVVRSRPNGGEVSGYKLVGMLLILLVVALLGACGNGNGTVDDTPDAGLLKGPYMGQSSPGMTPVKFLGDVLDHNFCSVFSPEGEEFYFTHYDPASGACSIEVMTMNGDIWGPPEAAPFSSDFVDNDIGMSSDGARVVFRSNRPLPGGDSGKKRDGLYLWTSVRTDSGWSAPEVVSFDGRTDIPGGYPALTDEGFIYFTANEPGESGPKDIYRSRIGETGFEKPEKLGEAANSPYGEGDLFVAPDGSFLIVSCYDHPENTGGGSLDLWVSFRTGDDSWSPPVNPGPPINTDFGENCPMISPDGRFLFFNRYTGEEDRDENGTYWVDARILDRYRPREN